jgi:arylsulfatase A-like enzyme
MLGNHRLWGKHTCGYEDVLNVPLIACGAGMPRSRACNEMVMLIDVLPTCLEAAGIAPQGDVDGRPLRRSMSGGGYDFIFSEGEQFATVSDGRFKLIRAMRDGQVLSELFDLNIDPGETTPLRPETARDVLQKLHAVLSERFTDRLLP